MKSRTDIADTSSYRGETGYEVQIIDRDQQRADKNNCNIGQNEIRDLNDYLSRQLRIIERDRYDTVWMQAQRKASADQLQTDQNPHAFDAAGGG